jgi:hypothetical protein
MPQAGASAFARQYPSLPRGEPALASAQIPKNHKGAVRTLEARSSTDLVLVVSSSDAEPVPARVAAEKAEKEVGGFGTRSYCRWIRAIDDRPVVHLAENLQTAEVPRPVMSVSSLALIGNASAHNTWDEDVSPIRGIFDKETRRKPLAFAADAAAMAIGCCFGTRSRRRIVGGVAE